MTIGVLKSMKHEKFAQELAKGKTQIEAYKAAGYKPHDSNAAALAKEAHIQARVSEIIGRIAARTEVTIEKIVKQWALIGFADIREAVEWDGQMVMLKKSTKLDDLTALAISEVKQGKDGVSLKMCSKESALSKLADWMRMFEPKVQQLGCTSPNNTINIKEDPQRAARAILFALNMLSGKQNQLVTVDQKTNEESAAG